jgi:gliding motility-associated-like protein
VKRWTPILLCLICQQLYVYAQTGISLSISSNGTTCGSSNGSIIATASGGTAPYSYSENSYPPQNNGNFINLGAGNYTITVSDANGATTTQNVTLTNTLSPVGVTWAITNASGCTTTDGKLIVTATGGTPPFQYSIDELDYQTSNTFPNLTAGLYYPSVKDADGCVSRDDILNGQAVIKSPCPIIQEGIGTGYSCDPFQGEYILYNVAGGTAPYQYSLDGVNYQSSYMFYGLTAGLYTMWVKDANGQIMLYACAIVNRCGPVYSLSATSQPAECGASDGTITAIVIDGISPYQYSLNGGAPQSGNVFTGLAAGNYTITVTDAINRQTSTTVTVSTACLSASVIATNGTCGNNNGSIAVTAVNGVTPYLYSLNGGTSQTSNIFTGLAAGNYTMTVTDATGYASTASAVVNNAAGPTIANAAATATSCAGIDGTVLITAQGGQGALQYSLDGSHFQSSPDFTGVAAGSYQAEVQDDNGCTSFQPVMVTVNNTLTVNAGPDQTICQGSSVQLNAQSTANAWTWNPVDGLNNAQIENPVANPAQTTAYVVTATFGLCTATGSVTVNVRPAPIANPGNNDTTCFGKDIQLSGSGGVNYVWTPTTFLSDPNIAKPIVVHPTRSIIYSLQVTDIYQCSSLLDSAVTITVTPPADVFAGNDTSISIGEPLPLFAADVNNSGFNQYTWAPASGLSNPSIQDPIATPGQSVVYTVTAVTSDGCEGQASISIKVYARADIYVPNAFTPNGDGHNDILRAIPAGIQTFKYFAVFNRWGQEVFRTTDSAIGWNGGDSGLGTTTYVWMAAGIDYEGHLIERKGTVIRIK